MPLIPCPACLDGEPLVNPDCYLCDGQGTVCVPYAGDRFEIDSEERANWFLRKLAAIDAERARIKRQAEEILRGLETREASLRGRFEGELRHFVEGEIAKRGGKTKTLKFLQGTCSFRTVPMSLKIVDEEAAREFAGQTKPELLQEVVTVKFDTSGYRDLAKEWLSTQGDVLPGIDVVPERESFSIKF